MKEGRKTALWAINPFELETRPTSAVIDELREWSQATGHRIQPVHVLYVPSADAPPDEHGSWVRRYIPAVEAEISAYLRDMELPGLLEPKVLIQRGGFTTAAVDVLTQYAQDTQADWIVVSSKGRSGLRRMALGSFAESLLIRSPVPVWVFGHGQCARLDSRRLFFATDFSEVSRAAFAQVVEQARGLGARVTIFHCINLPEPLMSGAGAMGVSTGFPVDEYLRDQTEWARVRADDLIKLARAQGVEADFRLQQVVPSIADAIVFEARQVGAGVIALASESGAVGAAILGSHARQVIRQSECPVWVFGPNRPEPARRSAHVG